MEDNIYKLKATEAYLHKVLELVPDIDQSTLNSALYAFEAGFNMGIANNENELVKELSLKMMTM